MLLHEIRAIKSTRRERHQFALVIACAALLVGALLAWKKGVYPGIFIAALVIVLPVLIDTIFKTDTAIVLLPFQKVWMAIAVVLGFFMSRLILGIFFFGVFTTVRAVNRLIGKPLLDTTWDKAAKDSYWIKRDPTDYTPKHSERQF